MHPLVGGGQNVAYRSIHRPRMTPILRICADGGLVASGGRQCTRLRLGTQIRKETRRSPPLKSAAIRSIRSANVEFLRAALGFRLSKSLIRQPADQIDRVGKSAGAPCAG